MIDGTEKPKIPLKFAKCAAQYNKFGYKGLKNNKLLFFKNALFLPFPTLCNFESLVKLGIYASTPDLCLKYFVPSTLHCGLRNNV